MKKFNCFEYEKNAEYQVELDSNNSIILRMTNFNSYADFGNSLAALKSLVEQLHSIGSAKQLKHAKQAYKFLKEGK